MLASAAAAAEKAVIEQKSGPALLRFEAPKNEAGQVEIRLSDELILTLSVGGPASLEVAPVQELTPSKDWQVRNKSDPHTTAVDGEQMRWEQSFTLVPIKPGDLPLPLANLRYRLTPSADAWQEASWRPISVRVVTEIEHADLSELRDVTPPEEVPTEPASRWPYVLLGIGGTSLLLVAAWYWSRRHWRGGQKMISPDQWALREIQRLTISELATSEEIERFHLQLSDVMRRYMELRFQVPALEQTTTEFFATLSRSPLLNADGQALFRDFMERCDLVKFALVRPGPEECGKLSEMACRFVTQTASGDPQEQTEGAEAPRKSNAS